jgi:hypothetical protein
MKSIQIKAYHNSAGVFGLHTLRSVACPMVIDINICRAVYRNMVQDSNTWRLVR